MKSIADSISGALAGGPPGDYPRAQGSRMCEVSDINLPYSSNCDYSRALHSSVVSGPRIRDLNIAAEVDKSCISGLGLELISPRQIADLMRQSKPLLSHPGEEVEAHGVAQAPRLGHLALDPEGRVDSTQIFARYAMGQYLAEER